MSHINVQRATESEYVDHFKCSVNDSSNKEMKVSSILGDLGNKFLYHKQPRTGSNVKTKIAEAYSNFQVPTTGLENHFQLKKLNSCILEYDTQNILNRLRIIDKKEILLPLKEHCVHIIHMMILPCQTDLKARTLICMTTSSIFRTMFQKK